MTEAAEGRPPAEEVLGQLREKVAALNESDATERDLEKARGEISSALMTLLDDRHRWIDRLRVEDDPAEREFIRERINELRLAHDSASDFLRAELDVMAARKQNELIRAQIASQREAAAASNAQAAASHDQTVAMVRWTRVLAFATVALIAATIASGFIARSGATAPTDEPALPAATSAP